MQITLSSFFFRSSSYPWRAENDSTILTAGNVYNFLAQKSINAQSPASRFGACSTHLHFVITFHLE